MTFDAHMLIEDGVATIRLSGELDARSASRFNDLIIDAAGHELSRLVLLAGNLTYMSSAGLRCLVFAHQKMPRGVEIVMVDAQPEVAEAIRLTGFDRSIVLQEAGDPR
jgi:anti-sigma B factor antagonist